MVRANEENIFKIVDKLQKDVCCFVDTDCTIVEDCLGISDEGNPDLVLNQEGNWIEVCLPPCGGGGGITELTVLEAQALATGSGFTAGGLYLITNAYSNTAQILFKAFSTSVLEDYGFGTFQNAAMTNPVYCQMWYDLIGDLLYRVYEPINNNDIIQNATDGCVSFFPFDGNNIGSIPQNNTLINVLIDSLLCASFNGNTILAGSEININDASITFVNNYIYAGCLIIILNSISIYGCRLGAGKVLDLTNIAAGYSQTGKVYDGNVSTFEVTSSDAAEVNPDGADTIDMAKFPWAGVLIVNAATPTLTDFANYPTDHGWKIISDGAAFVSIGGGNILYNLNGTITGVPFFSIASGDEVWFQAGVKGNSANKVQITNAIVAP